MLESIERDNLMNEKRVRLEKKMEFHFLALIVFIHRSSL